MLNNIEFYKLSVRHARYRLAWCHQRKNEGDATFLWVDGCNNVSDVVSKPVTQGTFDVLMPQMNGHQVIQALWECEMYTYPAQAEQSDTVVAELTETKLALEEIQAQARFAAAVLVADEPDVGEKMAGAALIPDPAAEDRGAGTAKVPVGQGGDDPT